MPAHDRLIVALDFPGAAEARRMVGALRDVTRFFKVGKQLFTAEGPDFIRELTRQGNRVFLDLKYHDIPNTVAQAVTAASELGVFMLNLHAFGGAKMLEAAANAAAKAPRPPILLAVTVLTSLADSDLKAIGVSGPALEQVLRLARLAQGSGCDGVVASALEARALRRELGSKFVIATPGVRPAGAEANDQARMATPTEALAAGADYIIVGRPITAAPDPAATARAVLQELAGAATLLTAR